MTSKFLSFKKTLWLFIKFFSILIFLLFNLVVIFSFTWNLFTPVKKVKFVGYPIDKQSTLKKLELEKKSILFLSTQDLEEKLKNPTTKIQLTKFLPYFIHFSVSKKEPLAYLQIGKKSFFLDSEELAFPVSAFNNLNLPIIRFSKTFHKDNQYLKINDILALEEVQKTLKILKIINKKQGYFPEEVFAKNYPIEIEIENPLNILWFISLGKEKIPVSLGYNFFELKIKTLGLVLTRLEKDINRVKKIDARYADKLIINYR